MNIYDKYINNILLGFNKYKGNAFTYIKKPINTFPIIITIIEKFLSKNNDRKVLLIFGEIDEFKTFVDTVKRENNSILDSISYLSEKSINEKYEYNYDLIIYINITNFSIYKFIKDKTKFNFVIFNDNSNNIIYNKTKNDLPEIINTIIVEQVINDYIHSPVKETLINVDINDEDLDKYNKYTDYITSSIKIFGDLSTMDKCRQGDKNMNISNIQYCNEIAYINGWNYNLDVQNEFDRQIDNIYNPNVLLERATNTYNIMRSRRELVSNNTNKLKVLLDIINKINIDYNYPKILIFSKNGIFASDITKYLNDNAVDCLNYHNDLEPIDYYDENGSLIRYKSGARKGEVKKISSTKQCSINLDKFNNNIVNILSCKYASDNKLNCSCDIIINTSTLYNNIFDIKKRYINVYFRYNPILVYTLYTDSTIEKTMLKHINSANNYVVIKNDDDEITIDENNNEIIL